jgi:ADP-ribose pyrophosphatase YjhB (NUDIX family)
VSGQRAVAVVLDGPRVLLIKRYLRKPSPEVCIMCRTLGAAGPQCPGHHYAVLPGGHVEEGEPAETAVVRELAEETTLGGRIDRVLWTGRHNEREATYFLMTDVAGEPALSGPELAKNTAENSFELVWATADELAGLGLHPADVRAPLASLLAEGHARVG